MLENSLDSIWGGPSFSTTVNEASVLRVVTDLHSAGFMDDRTRARVRAWMEFNQTLHADSTDQEYLLWVHIIYSKLEHIARS